MTRPVPTDELRAAPAGEPPHSTIEETGAETPVTPEIFLPQNAPAYLAAGIFLLLTLFALYFTGALVVPVILAIGLYLTLKPVMRLAGKLRIPRLIAAALIIVAFFGGVGALGFTLSDPAAEWVSKAPDSLRRLESRLFFFKRPIADLQTVTKQVDKITEPTAAEAAAVKLATPGLSSRLFSGTSAALIGLGTTIILLFFFLVSGDLFLRRFVEILPTFSNKKQAVEISREIERNISTYLATITLMNLLVGILTGAVVYACGMSDPVLWGTLIFLLNYIPIIGPLCGMGMLLLAGLLTFEPLWQAALPAGVYLIIHLLEGQFITPMLLARKFTLNPVLVILSIIFWYWMWGVSGALLAVPLLATVKIVCDRIAPLAAIGHFLGGEARP
ncbi:MAG TPA: AI-2E family transporter [Dongiaceae bacterium]|nr:AI-2E family transporter [Dongiaceae bacterium]